jgi:hypothetical protein
MTAIHITFSTPPDEDNWPPYGAERVWAEEISPQSARIDNVPFFTREATFGDVVEYRIAADGVREFVRVLVPSESSLVRVLLLERPDFDRVQARLIEMGCVVEGHAARLMLAVSIPATIDIHEPMNYLVDLADLGKLEYEEAILRL